MPIDNSGQHTPADSEESRSQQTPRRGYSNSPLLEAAAGGMYFSALSVFSRSSLWQYAIDNSDINRIASLAEQYPQDLNSTFKFRIPSLQVFAGDNCESTVLSYALRKFLWKEFSQEILEILECLLRSRANPNLSDKNNGKPYETAFATFVINILPSCKRPDFSWTQQQRLQVVRLLLAWGADPNVVYDTADYIRLSPNTYEQPPKDRTLLIDFARWQHQPHFPQAYAGLIETLSQSGKLEPNKIVNDKTALDYAFEQYFVNLRLINGKLVELYSDEDIWAISELVSAGASKVTKKLSISEVSDPRRYAVNKSFITRIFEQSLLRDMRAGKNLDTNLVARLQDIFDIPATRALSIAQELMRQADAKGKRKSRQLSP